MRDSRTRELDPAWLRRTRNGGCRLEPFLESMKAQQAMLTSLSQAIQGLSDATKSADGLAGH